MRVFAEAGQISGVFICGCGHELMYANRRCLPMEVVTVLRWRLNGKRFHSNDLVILMHILTGIKAKSLKSYLEGTSLVRLEFSA